MSRSFFICGLARASASLVLAGAAVIVAGPADSSVSVVSRTPTLRPVQLARPIVRAPRMDAAGCSKAVVYAASYNNTVYIYDQIRTRKAACGSITGLVNPQGLFVDKSRNLWIVNGGNGRTVLGEVLEFSPGNPSPVKTLQDSAGAPVDVAIDHKSGTAYVSNITQKGSLPGAIEVYAGGSTTPTATLTDPEMTYAFYDAVDNQGNPYVTFLHATSTMGVGQVDEWIGGSGSPLNLGITLQAPGGIQTTSTGALLICDQLAPACGDFAPGSTTMTDKFATTDSDPFAVALDKHEKHAWVEDTGTGDLQHWTYPGPDAKPLSQFAVTGGAYAGVAASPAAPPGAPW